MYERSFRFGEPQRGVEPLSPIWQGRRHAVRPLRPVLIMWTWRTRKWQSVKSNLYQGGNSYGL